MCCYDNDDKLIDSRYGEGGTLQRYHYLGGQDVQPFIANFYFDVLPFLYCCRYSKQYLQGIKSKSSRFSSTCPRYIQRRQKSTCVHYKPPRPGKYNVEGALAVNYLLFCGRVIVRCTCHNGDVLYFYDGFFLYSSSNCWRSPFNYT